MCLCPLPPQLADRVEATPCYHPGEDALLLGCYDGCVYALGRSDGGVMWRVATGDTVKCCPVSVTAPVGVVAVGGCLPPSLVLCVKLGAYLSSHV